MKPNVAPTIAPERPDSADAVELIGELEAHLAQRYPAASRHGFSVAKLIDEGVAFFVLRHDGAPAACGGVLLVGTEYGELKRMYVRPAFRRLGFGMLMLNHLAEHTAVHGVRLLRLETGVHQTEAIGLYERIGFRQIAPFGPYRHDPLSRCYEMRIT
jgi:putative acetyltransferase